MVMNQFTLNNLYNNGILDYVPLDLAAPSSMVAFSTMQNPYLNSAMSGKLYQNYTNANDSFNRMSGGISGGYMEQNAADNWTGAFGALNGNISFNKLGNAGVNGFGVQGVGAQSNAGVNGFGVQGVGAQSNAGVNGFGGGFGHLGENVARAIDSVPTVVKGLISAGIVLGTVILCCKKSKKPVPKQNQNFFTKIFKRK